MDHTQAAWNSGGKIFLVLEPWVLLPRVSRTKPVIPQTNCQQYQKNLCIKKLLVMLKSLFSLALGRFTTYIMIWKAELHTIICSAKLSFWHNCPDYYFNCEIIIFTGCTSWTVKEFTINNFYYIVEALMIVIVII